MINQIPSGVIEVGEKETDLLLDGETDLPLLVDLDNVGYEYNQGKTKDCTIYSSIGALSDLMNYEFSQSEIDEIVEESYNQGRIRGNGRYTQSGVNLVCKRWNNKYPNKKVIYFRIDINSNNFKEALNKKHRVVVSYRGNTDYQLDYSKDGIVNGTEFKPTTYGHATTSIKVDDSDGIKDSYKGRTYNKRPTNIYKLRDIIGLVESGNFYPSAYIILPEEKSQKTLEELKRYKELELKLQQAIQLNSDMWYMTNIETPSMGNEFSKQRLNETNNILRQKLKQVQNDLKAF